MTENYNRSKVTDNGTLSKPVKTVAQQVLEKSQVIGEIILLILKIFYYIGLSIYHAIIPVPQKPVKGEVVLITGTGHGIGKQLAIKYAAEGAIVVGWDINDNQETLKEITAKGYAKPYCYTVDVSKREEVLKAAKRVKEDVGDVTVLINNAGIMPTRPFLEQSTEEIDKTMNININAHFWMLQAFLPAMKKNNHGHIVALCSVAGILGLGNLVPYCASKFAVRGLMQALFEELKENPNNRIQLTTIMPYMVDTGLCKKPVIKFESLMPLLKPEEVAEAIMHAQRTDMLEVTVPRYIYNLNNIARVLPLKASLAVKDFIGSGVLSDT